MLLWHSDSSGAGVRLSGLALQSRCHADEGIGVAAGQALRIIYEDGDYTMSLIRAGLDTLQSRREELTKRFFKRSVLPDTSCLHYLLPDNRRRQTASCENITTFKITYCQISKFFYASLFRPLCLGFYLLGYFWT